MKNRVCPCQLTLRIPVHTAHGDFSGGDGGFCPVGVGNEKGRLFVDAVGVGVGHVVAPDELDVLSDGDAVGGKFPQPGVFFGEQGLLQFAKRPDEGAAGIRTRDLRLRRPLLYPAELQAHTVYPAR